MGEVKRSDSKGNINNLLNDIRGEISLAFTVITLPFLLLPRFFLLPTFLLALFAPFITSFWIFR
jgi:hypothetical protein